jgi:hypothetical protein
MAPRYQRFVYLALGLGAVLGVACGGAGDEQASFASSKVEAVPTNVSGAGTTSGIGAGASLSPGGSTGGAGTPTPTPTVTPAPGK